MKKIILITVAITLAGIIALCALLFGIFALFSPKVLGNVSKEWGNNSAAVYFYGSQYKKTSSTFDLAKLVYILYMADESATNSEEFKNYSYELIDREDFSNYCKGAGAKEFDGEVDCAKFYYGCAFYSANEFGELEKASQISNQFKVNYGVELSGAGA